MILKTEAAEAILHYGFEKLGFSRLICRIDQENLASIKVATKIGLTFEREDKEEMGPFLIYSRNKWAVHRRFPPPLLGRVSYPYLSLRAFFAQQSRFS